MTWTGNIRAQRQADKAWRKLRVANGLVRRKAKFAKHLELLVDRKERRKVTSPYRTKRFLATKKRLWKRCHRKCVRCGGKENLSVQMRTLVGDIFTAADEELTVYCRPCALKLTTPAVLEARRLAEETGDLDAEYAAIVKNF